MNGLIRLTKKGKKENTERRVVISGDEYLYQFRRFTAGSRKLNSTNEW